MEYFLVEILHFIILHYIYLGNVKMNKQAFPGVPLGGVSKTEISFEEANAGGSDEVYNAPSSSLGFPPAAVGART